LKFLFLSFIALFFSRAAFTQPANNNGGTSKSLYIPSEKIILYQLGDRTVHIRILQYGNVKDVVCINIHDNETTSVKAAMLTL
jgi:hypothetical protein